MLVSGGEKHLTSNTESILELENWNMETMGQRMQIWELVGKGKAQTDVLKQILQRQKQQ